MAFYLRKSIRCGPIRLNFSKSGIGVSAGVKGARISTGPRGTYIHAGSNGFYYRQRIDPNSRQNIQPGPTNGVTSPSWSASEHFVIKTADVSALRETSITKVLDEINERASKARFGPIALGLTTLATILVWTVSQAISTAIVDSVESQSASALPIFVAFVTSLPVAGLGLVLSWQVHKGDELDRTTPLFYELEPEAAAKFRKIQEACRTLAQTSKAWRVHTNQPTWDWKRNAGASTLITRAPVHFGIQSPPYIATNVDVWSITLNDFTLYFLPDYIFARQAKRYGAVSYKSFGVSFSPSQFIEDQGVPRDTQVLDYTWRYVNKKGGPDRRFSNNFQIPIVQYGFLQFQSNTGLNVHLHTSSVAAASAFAAGITSLNPSRSEGQTHHTQTRRERAERTYIDPKIKIALETLGVTTIASKEDVVAAYRNMAKMYHPDKLTHLAPEFVELAEERMKEINTAYETLKRHYGN